jgi:hypothetical protein
MVAWIDRWRLVSMRGGGVVLLHPRALSLPPGGRARLRVVAAGTLVRVCVCECARARVCREQKRLMKGFVARAPGAASAFF